MKINFDNLKWALRLMLILLLVGVADALALMLMPKPFPFTVLIPCSTPILVALFVIIPMTRAHKLEPGRHSQRRCAPGR